MFPYNMLTGLLPTGFDGTLYLVLLYSQCFACTYIQPVRHLCIIPVDQGDEVFGGLSFNCHSDTGTLGLQYCTRKRTRPINACCSLAATISVGPVTSLTLQQFCFPIETHREFRSRTKAFVRLPAGGIRCC